MNKEYTEEQQEWLKKITSMVGTWGYAICEYVWNKNTNNIEFYIAEPLSYNKEEARKWVIIRAEKLSVDKYLQDKFCIQEQEKDNFIDEYVYEQLNERFNHFGDEIPSTKKLLAKAEIILRLYETLYERISEYVKEHPYEEVFGKEQDKDKEL